MALSSLRGHSCDETKLSLLFCSPTYLLQMYLCYSDTLKLKAAAPGQKTLGDSMPCTGQKVVTYYGVQQMPIPFLIAAVIGHK